MRVLIAAVGKAAPGPERDLTARYLERAERAGRTLGLTRFDLAELAESRLREAAQRKAAEAADLLAKVPDGAAILALDEHGLDVDSRGFAARLAAFRDRGVPATACLIGGPDGHGEAVRARADAVIAFGRATWPHLLVRVLLAEQLYRATTILSGHPYHRA